MIRVEKINWISFEAKEAEVYLFDGEYRLKTFFQPYEGVANCENLMLFAFNVKEIIKMEGAQCLVENHQNSFFYKIVALLYRKKYNIIKLGDFLIELDFPVPGDIEEGDFISFTCERIDG